MKIAFIGGGNMGEAMLSAVLGKKLRLPQDIVVSDADAGRRQYIKQKYGVGVTGDNRLAVYKTSVVVLAVKPQSLAGLMPDLSGQLAPMQLVLSIIAGVSLEKLQKGLNHKAVIRAMPNTPAQIGQGITVWTAAAETAPAQREAARAILGAIGREISVEDERYLDMATAVSGSGPAYFFLFLETLAEAAGQIGLPREMAQELALQTMLGAGHLVQETGKDPAELRRMVTSPGGTTAAALRELEAGGFSGLLIKAVRAAYARAGELGKEPE